MNKDELKLLRRTIRAPYSDKFGCTQSEMAKLLGISRAQYARYEAGKKISGPVKIILKTITEAQEQKTSNH